MTTLPKVRELMDTDTHAQNVDRGLRKTVHTLIDEGITGAPVVENGMLVGMITEAECLRWMTRGEDDRGLPTGTARDLMTTNFITVNPDMDIYYVAGLFNANPQVRRFAVVQGDRLVAVITRKDILRAVVALLPQP